MKIQIINPGPLTSVQDAGRFGYMEYGITSSGVMDMDAYHIVNKLVGNHEGEAVLEATLMGPTFQVGGEGLFAFYGADMPATLDGVPLERGKAYPVKDGQTVAFGMAKSGVRTYIAFAGGIDVPIVMGSRSTNMKCGIGGYQGRKLAGADVLSVAEPKEGEKTWEKLMKHSVPAKDYPSQISIWVVLGPQDDYFTKKGLDTFLHTAYQVSPQSDRMGIRFLGEAIEGVSSMDIVSDGITFGSIQITSEGLPIILMADHQTTGGYAKIATVVTEDLCKLAQARPGDHVTFEAVPVEAVQKKKSWFHS